MQKIVPTISHNVVGPSGITHLPRLWLKAILKSTDSCAEGWNSGYRGMDSWLIDDLAVPTEPLFEFLGTIPTYAETERWVLAHAGKTDAESVAAHNKRVLEFNMPEQSGKPRREDLRIAHTDIWNAVMLNDLDDWNCFHAAVTAERGTKREPIVPLVSSQTAGPLGIKHLPRLWAKAIIHGAGALPDQWRSGPVRVVYSDGVPSLVETPGGVDAMTLEHIGLDMHETCQYLLAKAPTYLEFEDWVRAHATKLDPASIAAHNAGPWEVNGEKPAAEVARCGYPGMVPLNTFLYNDLGDWDAIRTQMLERRKAAA
jgi:hypothetical protein